MEGEVDVVMGIDVGAFVMYFTQVKDIEVVDNVKAITQVELYDRNVIQTFPTTTSFCCFLFE